MVEITQKLDHLLTPIASPHPIRNVHETPLTHANCCGLVALQSNQSAAIRYVSLTLSDLFSLAKNPAYSVHQRSLQCTPLRHPVPRPRASCRACTSRGRDHQRHECSNTGPRRRGAPGWVARDDAAATCARQASDGGGWHRVEACASQPGS